MSQLLDELNLILQEKQDKIKPENIKKDIQIFDITGTYEGNSGGVKLFETEEQMQQDPNANEGDLAIVYREEISNMLVDTQAQYITFPETVTLPNAITESYYCMLRAVDTSTMFDGQILLDQNMFDFNGYTENGMIRVRYESEDGINYTRTRFDGDSGNLTNPVDFSTTIQVYMSEEWNDNFGYFMQSGGMTFDGLFEYNTIDDTDNLAFYPIENFSFDINEYKASNLTVSLNNPITFNYSAIKEIINNFNETDTPSIGIWYANTNNELCFTAYTYSSNNTNRLAYDWDKTFLGITAFNSGRKYTINTYKANLDDGTYTKIATLSSTDDTYIMWTTSSKWYYIPIADMKTLPIAIYTYDASCSISLIVGSKNYVANGTNTHNNTPYSPYLKKSLYMYAPTQLTATKDSVYNSTYYGKDGIEEGTLTKAPATTFNDVNAEVYYKLIQAYNNMEPVKVQNGQTFQDAYFISNSKGESLLDLSEVTNASLMFYGNNYISDYSNLNISNIENASNMFERALIDDISSFNFNSVSNAYYMFAYTKIKEIINLNLPNVTNADGMFRFCSDITSIDNINAPNISGSNTMFQGCSNLTSVNDLTLKGNCNSCFADCSNLITISNINTTEITNVIGMFENCISLKDCPALSISNVSDMQDMFSECTSLSNESLNNILQMCIDSAVQSSSYKTLKYIGLSEEQAQKCTTLSNWSALEAKGWITGY